MIQSITIDTIDPDAIAAAFDTADPIGPYLSRMLAAARAYAAAETDETELRRNAAEKKYDAAKVLLLDSDEPIPWTCSEDGYAWRTVLSATAKDALDAIHDEIGDYDTTEGTLWLEHRVDSMVHDESERETIAIEPDEPNCLSGHEHDWQSPYEVLGGLEENPGVWGHGGGVIIREVCSHCGTYRVTDTWAQDMSTGKQGLRSVAYKDPDDASLAYASHCAVP